MATTDRFTDQTGHRIRFEWGRAGASALADQVRACVIVDVLSFSTAVSVAADAGIVVHPWPWRLEPGATDATEAVRAARALGATPAAHRDRGRLDPAAVTLSPQSLRRNAASTRRVLLPSPNGATISAALADYGVDVLAGCLRNRSAVARRLATLLDAGESIAILAAGERWPDGTLRPAAEDLLGAGAILSALVEAGHDDLSLEARLAVASWREVAVGRAGFAPRDAAQPGTTRQASLLRAAIGDSASGRELAGRGDAPDLDIAAECDASSIVPQLVSGAFVPHHDGVVIRPATADDAEQVATVWLRAWESALASVRRAHSDDEVRGWVRDILLPGDRTWVAESAGDARAHAGAVVGLLTTHDDWVHQLYVDPSAQGRGIGSALLAVAGARHPNRLELWTFQVNAGARRFYERHGFTAVEFTDGQGNEEREPDVRYLRPAVPLRQPYRGPVDDQGTASVTSPLRPRRRIVIVGAGVAGLTAARSLAADHEVVVLDKGRYAGGRLATRSLADPELPPGSGLTADHGAQFITTHTAEFAALVAQWQALGLVMPWFHGQVGPGGLPDDTSADGHPRYRGVPSMRALADHLAAGLDVRLQTTVRAIWHDDAGWRIDTGPDAAGGLTHHADALILTPPVPQSLDLLVAGGTELVAADEAALRAVRYDPCLALLVPLTGPSGLPAPGAIDPATGPIEWLADNQVKGTSPGPVLTIHADARYSAQAWHASIEDVAADLLAAAQLARYGDAEPWPALMQLQRWRYARPVVTHPGRCLRAMGTPPLVFAGDGFGDAKVEGAMLSGVEAARQLLS